MPTAENVARTRVIFYGAAGALFFVFATVAMVNGGIPATDHWYADLRVLPGLIGVIVALISIASGFAAGRQHAGMAYDEGYRAVRDRAQRIGFWTGVWSPAVMAVLAAAGLIPTGPEVYTVVIFMVSAFFLSFAYLDLREDA